LNAYEICGKRDREKEGRGKSRDSIIGQAFPTVSDLTRNQAEKKQRSVGKGVKVAT